MYTGLGQTIPPEFLEGWQACKDRASAAKTFAEKARLVTECIAAFRERVEHHETERRVTKRVAEELYPDLPPEQALETYRRRRGAADVSAQVQGQGWPVIVAVGAGLLLLTLSGGGRRK